MCDDEILNDVRGLMNYITFMTITQTTPTKYILYFGETCVYDFIHILMKITKHLIILLYGHRVYFAYMYKKHMSFLTMNKAEVMLYILRKWKHKKVYIW